MKTAFGGVYKIFFLKYNYCNKKNDIGVTCMQNIFGKIKGLIASAKNTVATAFKPKAKTRRRNRNVNTARVVKRASSARSAGTSRKLPAIGNVAKSILPAFNAAGKWMQKAAKSVGAAIVQAGKTVGIFFASIFKAFGRWVSKFDKKLVYGCTAGISTVFIAAIVILCVTAAPKASAQSGKTPDNNQPDNSIALAAEHEEDADKSDDDDKSVITAAVAKNTKTETTKSEDIEIVTYKEGDVDPAVINIQERLMELNYMDDDIPTEKFGATTAQAIKYFQRKNDMEITGEVDPMTFAALYSVNAKPYTVSEGDDGADVHEIQERLVELGYMEQITGHFGESTTSAVKKFQEKNGLIVDGSVGEDTKEMLYSENAKANFMSYGEKSDKVKKYQEKLKALGYLTTEADGTYGQDTVNAVKRFQTMNGMIADGFLGPSTIKLLDSGNGKANALVLGVSGSDVLRIQNRLVELGYLKNATGYFGSDTETAIKKFQSRNGLSADGKVGTYTMNVLFSSSAKKNSGGTSSSSGGSSSSSSHPSGGGSSSSSGSSGGSSGGGTVSYNKSVSSLLSVAKSKLGCRYVLGGKGPSTFDCSGFVYYCLNKIGVNQSYWTSSMWRGNSKYQKITSMSSIKAGDIISFGNGLNHVGIALGNGQMIDASSGDGCIRITNLNQSYWRTHFYAAYRVLS